MVRATKGRFCTLGESLRDYWGRSMLLHFSIRNFRSIDELTLDLSFAEGKAPNCYDMMRECVFCEPKRFELRLVSCLALYGANASGKSNILKALSVLKGIATGETANAKTATVHFDQAYFPNYFLAEGRTTLLSLEFVAENQLYRYAIEYDGQGIVREELFEKSRPVYRISNGCLEMECHPPKSTGKRKHFVEFFKSAYPDNTRQDMRLDCTFLSKLAKEYRCPGRSIERVFAYFQKLEIHFTNIFPFIPVLKRLAEKGNTSTAFAESVRFLQKLDTGIVRMQLDRQRPAKDFCHADTPLEDRVLVIRSDGHGREIALDLVRDESEGTKVVAGLVGMSLLVLKTGGVLVVDGLDKSMHSLVFREIVRLFKDREYNRHNSQLVFTAHNTDLLDADTLRVSEVGIVDKNQDGGTIVHRISDYRDMRNVLNFRKQYLQGSFQGLPKVVSGVWHDPMWHVNRLHD